jgi:hypothetical protein
MVLSKESEQTIALILRRSQQSLQRSTERAVRESRRVASQEAQRIREIEARRNKYTKNERRNLKLAVKGTQNLIALAKEESVAMLCSLNKGWFTFYDATRPSGNDWETFRVNSEITRNVRVELRATTIVVASGAPHAGDGSSLEISFPNTPELASTLHASWLPWGFDDADAFLALNPRQQKYQWNEEHIAAQVLIDCADPIKLQRFFQIALKRFGRK